jgi:CheY-like chemotaxis protein
MTKILVVEDSREVLNNISQILSINGYDVDTAENGKAGLERVNKNMPDLIISDIMMPEMDGHRFFSELKKNPATSLIPFIFLTAKASPEAVREGMKEGADDYIVKPFRAADLLDAVKTRLNKKNHWESKLTEITSNISSCVPHELRTPLVSIIGLTDIMCTDFDELRKEEMIDMLNMIKSSSQKLHKTIEKFLLYSGVVLSSNGSEQSGNNEKAEVIDIKMPISTIARTKMAAENRIADLQMDLKSAFIKIDSGYFRFIVEEIIENAVKFSPKGSPIEIYTETFDGKVNIKITDHGRGMTEQELNSIGPFLQHNRDYFQQPGIGLGLVIVKKLVSIYEGEILIDSTKGSYTSVVLSFNIAMN